MQLSLSNPMIDRDSDSDISLSSIRESMSNIGVQRMKINVLRHRQ